MKKTFLDFGIEIPYGRTGGHVKTTCPNCRAHRGHPADRSLSVDLDKGVWKCHHCGWTGGLGSSSEAPLRRWTERPIRHREPRQYKKPPMPASKPGELSRRALDWFASRGISAATVKALGITEGRAWMPGKEGASGETDTVQFNYYCGGELRNVKYRSLDEKSFRLFQGAELLPYNIDALQDDRSICIVTEGEMDALSFREIELPYVVSVPNGAGGNLSWLDDYMEKYFDDKERIYIAVDTDGAGLHLRGELVRRFGAERCLVVEYGADCKDANEHLMKHGKDSLLQCLTHAREAKVEGVLAVTDEGDETRDIYDNGFAQGVAIGHDNFDRLCVFTPGQLCVVTGAPGSGKSEFVDEIAERLNVRYGWRTAFFSPENYPIRHHNVKLISKLTGKEVVEAGRRAKEYQERYGYACPELLSAEEFTAALNYADDNFFFIAPPADARLSSILEIAAYLVRRRGIKMLVVDPYNCLESECPPHQTETQYIGVTLDRLTSFAREHDVLVTLVAHPAKPARSAEGKPAPPTLYDISGSANFYNKADYGIVIYRDKERGVTEVNVEKVRFRHLGYGGRAYFCFNELNGRFAPVKETGPGSFSKPAWDNANHLAHQYSSSSSSLKLS